MKLNFSDWQFEPDARLASGVKCYRSEVENYVVILEFLDGVCQIGHFFNHNLPYFSKGGHQILNLNKDLKVNSSELPEGIDQIEINFSISQQWP